MGEVHESGEEFMAAIEAQGLTFGEWLLQQGIDVADFDAERDWAVRSAMEAGHPPDIAMGALWGSAFAQGYALAWRRFRAGEE